MISEDEPIPFVTMTEPIAACLRSYPNSRRVIGHILESMERRGNDRAQGCWGMSGDGWHLEARMARRAISISMQFCPERSTIGADNLRGDALTLYGVTVPETTIVGVAGRRLSEVVSLPEGYGIPSDCRVRTAKRLDQGIRLRLDLPEVEVRMFELKTMPIGD